jgi:PAS domain S-box-containing protein
MDISHNQIDFPLLDEAIQMKPQWLRDSFDHSIQLIGLLKPDGTLLEANQKALDFMGVRREAVVGRAFWLTPWWMHSPELPLVKAAIAKAALGETIRMEVTFRSAKGVLTPFDFSLSPVPDETGAVAFLMAEARDILERKHTEQRIQHSRHEVEQRVVAQLAELSLINAKLQQEVQDRHQAEADLRESETRYRTISALTSDFIYSYSVTPEGSFTDDWMPPPLNFHAELFLRGITQGRKWPP